MFRGRLTPPGAFKSQEKKKRKERDEAVASQGRFSTGPFCPNVPSVCKVLSKKVEGSISGGELGGIELSTPLVIL